MIAALLATALLATASPAPTPTGPPLRQVTLPASDLTFLAAFLDHYAGQGCDIHTAAGLDSCRSALRAIDVWQELQGATPVVAPKVKP